MYAEAPNRVTVHTLQPTSYIKRQIEERNRKELLERLFSQQEAFNQLNINALITNTVDVDWVGVRHWLEEVKVIERVKIKSKPIDFVEAYEYGVVWSAHQLRILIIKQLSASPIVAIAPYGRFYTSLYYRLPPESAELIAEWLNDLELKNSFPALEERHGFISYSWLQTEQDKLAFMAYLNDYPIIRDFLLHWLEQGVEPQLIGRIAVMERRKVAHYDDIGSEGIIFRSTDVALGYIPTFIHEFIHHIVERRITSDQKAKIEAYFRKNHPELIKLFSELKTYKGKETTDFVTEAMAYYLEMALSGTRKRTLYDGGRVSLSLKEEDVDFFYSLPVITEDMKENMKEMFHQNRNKWGAIKRWAEKQIESYL